MTIATREFTVQSLIIFSANYILPRVPSWIDYSCLHQTSPPRRYKSSYSLQLPHSRNRPALPLLRVSNIFAGLCPSLSYNPKASFPLFDLGMLTIYGAAILIAVLQISLSVAESSAGSARKLHALVEQQPLILKYHNGSLLKGNITVNLIWYGTFTPVQRAIIVDFIQSLNSPGVPPPSASLWWKTTEEYRGGSSVFVVGKQYSDPSYTLGRSLKGFHLTALAAKINALNGIHVVLTAKDVAVDGFCMSRCGTHGSTGLGDGEGRTAYIWVGNPEVQCPGQCAWPFHQPMYGPQTPPLVSPNGDVGVDGMIINLATLLAGTVTNPFRNGYFQGPPTAPLEAVSACTGIFGTGSYPGYPGRVLVDRASGASFNANGLNGRKFLLPAMWDPKTSACKPLV